jgi:aspartate/methionine/tyrosine aminotransferase
MTDRITDYLAWARHMGAILHGRTDLASLFASATREPHALLMAALTAAGQTGVLARLDAPMPWGHPLLLQRLREHYHVPQEKGILVTSGASMAFVVAALALTRPGDHAIVEHPIYQPFINVLQERGVNVSLCPRPTPDFQPDLDALAALFRPETRLIMLTNLHNPSGTLLDDATLRAIATLAARHNVTVVVDEVFHDLASDVDGRSRTAALLADNIVSISSLSKAYGLGRLRVGWIIATPDLMPRLRAVHINFDNSVSTLDQAIATLVVDDLPRYREHGQAAAAANRAAVRDFAAEMAAAGTLAGSVPAVGCTFFPKVCGVENTDTLVEMLEAQYRVVVVPGRFFHAPGHIRIGFGVDPAAVQEGLTRLRAGLLALV